MRKFSFFISLVLVILLPQSGNAQSSEPADSIDFGFLADMGHPKLLMSADDFAGIRAKLSADGAERTALYKADSVVMEVAERCIASPKEITYKLDVSGKRLLSVSRLALERLFNCAYAFRVTGRKNFLDRAIEDFRTVCAFPDWHPSHFLDVGEMALGVAIAYDWLYDELSEEDRAVAENCLVEYAMKPSHGQWWHKSVGNWNQVCNCGMAAAAIAVYEKTPEFAGSILNTAVRDNIMANTGIYSPDGNYPEGYNYWGYGTGFEVLLIALLEHACGSDYGLSQTPGFMRTGEYMLFMAGSSGKPFPYVDGGSSHESPKTGMWWFAARQNDPSLLFNEWRLVRDGNYLISDETRITAALPCYIKDCGFGDIGGRKPEKEFWYGRGLVPVAMIHTGWNFDEGDVYLGVKGGRAGHNHGHLDAGSFVFDSQGVRWSEDLGQLRYAPMENALREEDGDFWEMGQESLRWDILRMNNLFHSTVSFMNSDGSVEDKVHVSDHNVKGVATMPETFEDPYGVTIDMSAAVSDQVDTLLRTFKLIGEDLYIVDELRAKPGMNALMQWRMLTAASVETIPGGEKLSLEGKTLYLRAANDAGLPVEYRQWEMRRPEDWVPRNWDPDDSAYRLAGFSATVPAGTTAVFTTVLSAVK